MGLREQSFSSAPSIQSSIPSHHFDTGKHLPRSQVFSVGPQSLWSPIKIHCRVKIILFIYFYLLYII